ncbi:MAG: BlaI/MecI/CopY family transcriptional regulator [Propionibacteriaceae bacterium]
MAAPAPLSVRGVHDALDSSELAYTTIMTVLDRLARKRILLRERDGKAWLYRVVGSARSFWQETSSRRSARTGST